MEAQELKKDIIRMVEKLPESALRDVYELLAAKTRQHPSDEEFAEAMHYVLEKNAELYRRLA